MHKNMNIQLVRETLVGPLNLIMSNMSCTHLFGRVQTEEMF